MTKKIIALVVALVVAVAGLGIAVYASQADDSVEFVNSGKDYEISFELREGAEKFRLFAVINDVAQDEVTNEYLYKSDFVAATINDSKVTVASDVVLGFLNSLKESEQLASFDKVQIGALCFDGDGAAVKDKAIGATKVPGIVKLMPKDASSTAMIERNGIVETYNQGLNAENDGCYGVTSIIEAYDDVYQQNTEYDSADNKGWYIYGLNILDENGTVKNFTLADLKNAITVKNGSFKVFAAEDKELSTELTADDEGVGTGTIVVVYGKDSKEIERFRVVIFGDLDGVNSFRVDDVNEALYANNWLRAWGDKENPIYDAEYAYYDRASDVNDQNGMFTRDDYNELLYADNNLRSINQITGRTEVK